MQQIRDAVNAAAKMASIKMVTSTMEKALYGNSSSPRMIRDFEEFLVADPLDEAVTYGQDFLTQTMRGMGSGDYTSVSGGAGGDFLAQMLQDAGQGVLDQWEGTATPTVDYMDYCNLSGGSASFTGEGDVYGSIFGDGNFRCYSAIMDNPVNTPVGMMLAVDQATAAKYQQEQKIATLMATSEGVLPDMDENGNVRVPAHVIEFFQTASMETILDSLAASDTRAFSVIIQGFAATMITQIMQKGLGEVNEAIDRNMASFNRQYQKEYGSLMNTAGPEATYSHNSYDAAKRKTNPSAREWINPDTGKPVGG